MYNFYRSRIYQQYIEINKILIDHQLIVMLERCSKVSFEDSSEKKKISPQMNPLNTKVF